MTANLIPSTITEADALNAGATIALTQKTFVEVGSYTLEKGERITFGQGLHDALNSAIGRAVAVLKDGTSTEITGTWRILVSDMNDRAMFYILEEHSSELNTTSPRSDTYPLPLQDQGAKYGRKIKYYFSADAASQTIDVSKSTVKFSISKQYVSND